MQGATIEATGVEKRFGEHAVLRGVDLHVPASRVHALLGPNGAGKTTLVGVLTTLLRADGGRVVIGGIDVARDPAGARRKIGVTGQEVAIDPFLTGRECLRLHGHLGHLGQRRAAARADELLERFDLTDAADRRVGTWSGGMRRRLDLAVGLVRDPEVVFLDEPTTGLDPRSRAAFWALVRDLAAAGTTVLLTTQYLDEADQLADRISMIDGGRIVAEGTGAELKARLSGDRVVVSFPDGGAYDDAVAALVERPDLGHERHPDRLSLSVAAPDTVAAVRSLFEVLDQRSIPMASVSVERPTLDDVFLSMTGRAPESGTDGRAPESGPTGRAPATGEEVAA
jgi:ABC-2 type transport system ATP-binding protein